MYSLSGWLREATSDALDGIIVAGLGYGLIESFTAGYISTRAREIVGFGLVILVLVARPWGLLGAKPSRRV